MDFTTLIQNRYSCRVFATKPVEQEKVDRILEAGRIAPTAVNRQPVHVWAVSDSALLAGLLPGTEGYELVAMINVGYAAEGSAPSEKHWSRVGKGEFVTSIE